MPHPLAHDFRPRLLDPSLGLAPVGQPQAAFKSAPGAFVHAWLTWLVNYASARLMPDQAGDSNFSELFSESVL